MKALHVIRTLDPRWGGPTTVVRNVAKEQVRLGYDVTILTTTAQCIGGSEPRDAFENNIRNNPSYAGMEIYFAQAHGRLGPIESFAYAPQQKRWLRRRLADPDRVPDIIHIHGFFEYGAAVAAKMAQRHGIPYFVEPCGVLAPVYFQKRSSLLKQMYMKILFRGVLEQAACVHPASERELADTQVWAPNAKLRVVPHGADIPRFDPAESAEKFLAKFPQLKGKRIILFLSRVAPNKRPEMLVEAVARLRQDYPDLILLFAGSKGNDFEPVMAAVKKFAMEDAVVNAGFLEKEDKTGVFAVSDLFTLLSIEENFGIVVLEAMSHGIPVLVTPGVSSHVYVDESGGGLTVGDSLDEVVEGMRKLLEEDLKSLGEKGRQYVATNLTWQSVAKQIEGLYQEALARTP